VKTERRLVPPCWAAFFCAAAGCNQDDYQRTGEWRRGGPHFFKMPVAGGSSLDVAYGNIKCAAPWTGHDLALGLQMMLRIGNYEKLAERAEIRA
jgi:hypothetical protein